MKKLSHETYLSLGQRAPRTAAAPPALYSTRSHLKCAVSGIRSGRDSQTPSARRADPRGRTRSRCTRFSRRPPGGAARAATVKVRLERDPRKNVTASRRGAVHILERAYRIDRLVIRH